MEHWLSTSVEGQNHPGLFTDRQGARLEMYQSVTGLVEPKSYENIRQAQEENMLAEDVEEQDQLQYEEKDGYDDCGRLVAG